MKRSGAPALSGLRRRIDAVDRQLVRLLRSRARLALAVAHEKHRLGLRLRDGARENEVLDLVTRGRLDPMDAAEMRRLFALLMVQMRRMARRRLETFDRGRRHGRTAPRARARSGT